LVTKLTEARDEHRMGRLTREIAKTNLLIVDELSYVSFPRHSAELLFQVISERSERGSVIINTNLDFSKWDQIFSDHMLAAALVDRVEYSCAIRPALSPYPGTNPVTSGQDSCHIRPRFLRHSATVPALSGQ